MLILHPNSSCDVCLQSYGEDRLPHALTCGHVFCQSCLESLTRHHCPLCRSRFRAEDIMRLHVDPANSPRRSPSTGPLLDIHSGDSSATATKFQAAITRIVLEGAPASQLRALIDECHTWLKTQPHEQHTDLRASFLLMYNLTETQRKLTAESQALNESKNKTEGLIAQLATQQEEAERRYQDLIRANADERETALAVEQSLRQHYELLDQDWRGKYDAVLSECRMLRNDLDRCRLGLSPLSDLVPSVEVRRTQVESDERSRIANSLNAPQPCEGKDDVKGSEEALAEAIFRLSPLPANLPPLPSAILSFASLADEDDEFKKIGDDKPSFHDLRNNADPSLVGTPPRMSGIAISFSKVQDLGSASVSQSLPRGYGASVNDRSPSPVGRTSSAIPPLSHSSTLPRSFAQGLRTSDSKPISSLFRENEHADGSDQRDHWKAKLHEILDTPSSAASSSLPSSSYTSSFVDHGRTRSYSVSSAVTSKGQSSNSVPSKRSPTGTDRPLASSNILSQSPVASNLTSIQRGDIKRPVLISHASSAAMALEQERQRAERERRQQAHSGQTSPREKDYYPKHYASSAGNKGKLSSATTAGGVYA